MDRRIAAAAVLVLALTIANVLALGPFTDVSLQVGFRNGARSKYDGATVADVDRDGWYDLILSNHINPDRPPKWSVDWYWGSANGTFQWDDRLDQGRDWHGMVAGDFQNDGFVDIIACRGGGFGLEPLNPLIMKTSANREYTLAEGQQPNSEGGLALLEEGMRGRTARFIDIDGDGDLDLILFNAKAKNTAVHHFVYENTGDGNYVYRRNTGFEEIVQRQGVVGVFDVNNDGWMDFVIADRPGQTLRLFLGTGRFQYEERTELLPDGDYRGVVGITELDFDNDGDFDLYLSRGVSAGECESDCVDFHDKLLENREGRFIDVSESAGIPLGGDHQGVVAADFNNDGLIDIVVARKRASRRPPRHLLLLNLGNGRFETNALQDAYDPFPGSQGNTAQAFDYNRDGKVDLLFGAELGHWKLYRNDDPMEGQNYLHVRVGRKGNFTAMNAVVTVRTGDLTQIRRVGNTGETLSQSFMDTVHFGLGNRTRVDEVTVQYMRGRLLVRSSRRANRLIRFAKY